VGLEGSRLTSVMDTLTFSARSSSRSVCRSRISLLGQSSEVCWAVNTFRNVSKRRLVTSSITADLDDLSKNIRAQSNSPTCDRDRLCIILIYGTLVYIVKCNNTCISSLNDSHNVSFGDPTMYF
jgi:hypothetical protein